MLPHPRTSVWLIDSLPFAVFHLTILEASFWSADLVAKTRVSGICIKAFCSENENDLETLATHRHQGTGKSG